MDHNQLLEVFRATTGATIEEGTFFLESHNWNLEDATNTYFEDHGSPQQPVPEQIVQQPTFIGGNVNANASAKRKQHQHSGPRVGTLAGLDHSDDSDSEDDDKQQEWFAGGQQSGVNIKAPPREKVDKHQFVEDFFENAKKQGAAPPDQEDPQSQNFSGAGYRLGNTVNQPIQRQAPVVDPSQQEVTVRIVFYNDGFTVDDGPLRRLADPNNQGFLQDINKGIVPEELRQQVRSGILKCVLDRKLEDYKEPTRPQIVAFSGQGQKLGNSAAVAAPVQAVAAPIHAVAAPVAFSVDGSIPVTNIQIRLADGTRLVGKFNHSHTIQDLRNFVASARRLQPGQTFDLTTSYPPVKVFNDNSLTIEAAGLLNSVVVQKLK